MQSLGNDFVVLYNPLHLEKLTPDTIKALADRQLGIGFDQLLIVQKIHSAHYSYTIFNADGSPAKQCINGLRCLGHYLLEQTHHPSIVLENTSGQFTVQKSNGLTQIAIPLAAKQYRIEEQVGCTYVDIGNEHAFIPVTDIDCVDIAAVYNDICCQLAKADGINVTCYEALSASSFRSRTVERGAGETRACGSSACALGLLRAQYTPEITHYTIEQPGGEQSIIINDGVLLSLGKAHVVFSGKFTLPLR